MASQFDIVAIAKELVPDSTQTNSYDTVDSEPPFAKSVRDASVLIQGNNPFTYARLQRAVIEGFHKVYLRVAAKKITNFSFVYTTQNAIEMLRVVSATENDDRYNDDVDERFARHSGAIHSVVRRIAAAELIRMVPLNSSVKFKEDSDDLIKEAYEDLDRLLEVVASTATEETTEESKDLSLGQASVYIAYELDKANIPASTFDRPDPDSSPPTYLAPVTIDHIVETTKGLLIDESRETALCTIYMTAQAYNADVDLITDPLRGTDRTGSSAAVSLKIETSFIVRATDTIDSLIARISEEINSATLNATFDTVINISENYMSNIIVASQYQKPVIRTASVRKKILYPDIKVNEKRIAAFDTYYRTNRLSFETRRNSTKVDTELLTIGFYTIPRANAPAPQENIGQYLRTNNAKLGIKGLIYGQGESITDLQSNFPISLFLNVSKGNVAAVSIQKDTGSGAVAESEDRTAAGSLANQIDTFYFHVNHIDNSGVPITPNQPVFPTTDNELVLRISTSNYINEPSRLVSVNLSSIVYPGLVEGNTPGVFDSAVAVNYLGEDIADLVVDALYNEARASNLDTNIQSTNVLGAQLGDFDNYYTSINTTAGTASNILLEGLTTNDINEAYDGDSGRVQIVAFRYREQEYKAVVDIIKIPRLLWIATGNYQQRRTIWEPGRRRSISIETKDLKTSAGSAAETMTEAEVLNSVNASVSQTEARKSALLQSVYDKKRLLENVNYKGYYENGYYRRPQQWLR